MRLKAVEVRYGRFHNASMATVSLVIIGAGIGHFLLNPERAPSPSLEDTRFVLFVLLGGAMGFYAFVGLSRFTNRKPQVVIDRNGIMLGFGRDRHFAWNDVEWVRLGRVGLRPQLQIGLTPESFIAADLRLSMWNLDDALRPVRGVPTAIGVRDAGLDTSASAMLDAVERFRPNLVKP